MQFFCKLVKSCLHNDGIRDYQFLSDFNEAQLEMLAAASDSTLEKRRMRERHYYRISSGHFLLFGFEGEKKLRVEFRDYHPPETRTRLEDNFQNW